MHRSIKRHVAEVPAMSRLFDIEDNGRGDVVLVGISRRDCCRNDQRLRGHQIDCHGTVRASRAPGTASILAPECPCVERDKLAARRVDRRVGSGGGGSSVSGHASGGQRLIGRAAASNEADVTADVAARRFGRRKASTARAIWQPTDR